MPEGPEIWRAAARLGKVLDDQVVEAVEFTQPRLHNYGAVLSGCRVRQVQARGKAVVTHFDNNLYLYSHNQLYGRWYVRKRDSLPKTARTLRAALHTATHSALLYSASDIDVLDEAGLAHHGYLTKLGPEALDEGVHWRDIAARLTDPAFAGRRLASLYLDQHFVAGIGNYLRSEILFDAGVHPLMRPRDLSRGQVGTLARSTLEITRRSLRTGGVTNPDARARRLKKQGLAYGAYRHAVFARAGKACYSCGTDILRESMGSRRIYLCPTCQPGE